MRLLIALALCVVAVAAKSKTTLTDEELHLLAFTPYEYMPPGLKDAIRRSKIHKRDLNEGMEDDEDDRFG